MPAAKKGTRSSCGCEVVGGVGAEGQGGRECGGAGEAQTGGGGSGRRVDDMPRWGRGQHHTQSGPFGCCCVWERRGRQARRHRPPCRRGCPCPPPRGTPRRAWCRRPQTPPRPPSPTRCPPAGRLVGWARAHVRWGWQGLATPAGLALTSPKLRRWLPLAAAAAPGAAVAAASGDALQCPAPTCMTRVMPPPPPGRVHASWRKVLPSTSSMAEHTWRAAGRGVDAWMDGGHGGAVLGQHPTALLCHLHCGGAKPPKQEPRGACGMAGAGNHLGCPPASGCRGSSAQSGRACCGTGRGVG